MSDNNYKETWKPVLNFETHYQVSNLGRVRSLPRRVRLHSGHRTSPGKMLKPGSQLSGHQFVNLSRDGVAKTYLVHTLVLEAFVSHRPQGMEVCHNDGNPRNNKLSNLRWDTHRNNQRDMLRHGTANFKLGDGHQNAKLTQYQARKIRRLRQRGWMLRELAIEFNVHVETIGLVVRRRGRWAKKNCVECVSINPPKPTPGSLDFRG